MEAPKTSVVGAAGEGVSRVSSSGERVISAVIFAIVGFIVGVAEGFSVGVAVCLGVGVGGTEVFVGEEVGVGVGSGLLIVKSRLFNYQLTVDRLPPLVR